MKNYSARVITMSWALFFSGSLFFLDLSLSMAVLININRSLYGSPMGKEKSSSLANVANNNRGKA